MTTPFDPADWIERFTSAGGGFVSNGQAVHFCWTHPSQPLVDNVEARRLYWEMASDPNRLLAVRDLIGGTLPQEAHP